MASVKQIPSRDRLRQIILDLNEPVVFSGILDSENGGDSWGLIKLTSFIELFGDRALPFRITQNARTTVPQWDLLCPVESMTISEFIQKNEEISDKSYYFDYKYMHEWLKMNPEVLDAINWRCFGFDKSGVDSTLWIGSKGSHTNCHQDTYGCNLIAQIHGRKQWLLFPPDAGSVLKPTRVPYEESTIYSKFNFFCPSMKDEESMVNIAQMPKVVIIEPGQVLFVPKGWWHYVESLDMSLSINVWLEQESDCSDRLKEAVVQLIISQLGHTIPGIESIRADISPMHMVQECIKVCHRKNENTNESNDRKKMRKMRWNVQDLIQEYPEAIKKLDNLSKNDWRELLISNRERFSPDICEQEGTLATFDDIMESIVNVVCQSDVIDNIVLNLLNK